MLKKVTKLLLVCALMMQIVSPVITANADELSDADYTYDESLYENEVLLAEEVIEAETIMENNHTDESEYNTINDDPEYTGDEGSLELLNEGLVQIRDIFPDSVLAGIVAEELNLTVESYISLEDLAVITRIIASDDTLPSFGVESIEGLQYLVNIERFVVGDNMISDISPLSGLYNLQSLELQGNQISDISPLMNLANLTRLSLGGNQISDLSPLMNLANLTHLSLGGNQISDISPLMNLVNLTGLGLSGNQIMDLRPLGNLNIQYVNVRNQVITLPTVVIGEGTEIEIFFPDGTRINRLRGTSFSAQNFYYIDGILTWRYLTGENTALFDITRGGVRFSGTIHQEVTALENNEPIFVWTDEDYAIHIEDSERFNDLGVEAWRLFRYVKEMYLAGTLMEHPNSEELYRLLNEFDNQLANAEHSYPFDRRLPFDHEFNVAGRAEMNTSMELFEYFITQFTAALNYEAENNNNNSTRPTLPQTGTDMTLNTMLAGSGLVALGGLATYKKLKKD